MTYNLGNKSQDTSWILASRSASRRNMLDAAQFEYTCEPADIDESGAHKLLATTSASHVSILLAELKAQKISALFPNSFVIGSDQVMTFQNKLFSKPETIEQAKRNLNDVQGNWHTLTASACVAKNNKILFRTVDSAQLLMRKLSTKEIDDYLSNYWEEVAGTVGAYRLEAEGINLFDKISGHHTTILGMPLLELLKFYRNLKYDSTNRNIETLSK